MSEQEVPSVGVHLREFRHQRGLSLRALAELCELSPNTISLIERGTTSPSVSTLHRLATALGVHISDFFVEPGARTRLLLTRAEDRARSGSSSVRLESLGYGLDEQACDPFIVTLKAGASSGRHVMTHPGHELIFCLEGALDYEIEGEHHRLEPGDSLLFDATLPHRWSNPNSRPAKFILIMQLGEDRHISVDQHLHP
jgi:transcriptional regulator with XRE-family HTH domain